MRCIETSRGKLKYRIDLFPRYIELLDNLPYARAGFEVLKHGRYGHSSTAKHPCTAQAAWYAFNCRTLRPIKSSHSIRTFTETCIMNRRSAPSAKD